MKGEIFIMLQGLINYISRKLGRKIADEYLEPAMDKAVDQIYEKTDGEKKMAERAPQGMQIMSLPPKQTYQLYFIGGLIAVFFVVALVVSLQIDVIWQEAKEMWTVILVLLAICPFLMFWSGGLVKKRYVAFDDVQVIVHSPFGPEKEFLWQEAGELRFLSGGVVLQLYDKNGKMLMTANRGWANFEQFCQIASQHCTIKQF